MMVVAPSGMAPGATGTAPSRRVIMALPAFMRLCRLPISVTKP